MLLATRLGTRTFNTTWLEVKKHYSQGPDRTWPDGHKWPFWPSSHVRPIGLKGVCRYLPSGWKAKTRLKTLALEIFDLHVWNQECKQSMQLFSSIGARQNISCRYPVHFGDLSSFELQKVFNFNIWMFQYYHTATKKIIDNGLLLSMVMARPITSCYHYNN